MTALDSDTDQPTAGRRSTGPIIALCFATIVFDGYDLVVYGAIVPELLRYQPWGLNPVQTGQIGSLALLGMLIGALVVGALTDAIGRRKVMIGAVTLFSLCMLGSALAPTPEAFAALRFIGGLGLGGVIPTAIAITVEYSKTEQRNLNNALMFSGYAFGGLMSAILALLLLPHIGFRGLLAIGALPLITLVPLLIFMLPESPAYLVVRGKIKDARALRTRYGLDIGSEDPETAQPIPLAARLKQLLHGRWLIALILFSLAGIAGQTLVYGLSTWLPQLMIRAGYSMRSSLVFLLIVNVGAITGVIVSSWLADRFGPRRVAAASFVASGLALILLGTGWLPGFGTYLAVALVGFGSIGAQILINGYVATYYPDGTRATALGITLGLGRIGAMIAIVGGGVLVAAQLPTFTNFAIWAIPATVGLIAVLAVPSRPATDPETT